MLQKITRTMGIIVFVTILLMNIVIPYIMTFFTSAE